MMGRSFRRRWIPWVDPKFGYRNDPEYQRQRRAAPDVAAQNEIEKRWAARWRRKLAMQKVAKNETQGGEKAD